MTTQTISPRLSGVSWGLRSRRLVATFLDFLICVRLTQYAVGYWYMGTILWDENQWAVIGAYMIPAAVIFGYFALEGLTGGTIGKLVLNLRVTGYRQTRRPWLKRWARVLVKSSPFLLSGICWLVLLLRDTMRTPTWLVTTLGGILEPVIPALKRSDAVASIYGVPFFPVGDGLTLAYFVWGANLLALLIVGEFMILLPGGRSLVDRLSGTVVMRRRELHASGSGFEVQSENPPNGHGCNDFVAVTVFSQPPPIKRYF